MSERTTKGTETTSRNEAGAAEAIVCQGLGRRYGKTAAVESLDLSVRAGEFFALLGPNGAGKSTTLHILTTMLPPTSGSARVLGHDVVRHARAVRAGIGVVFQEPALDERLTAAENLQIHLALYGLSPGRHRERVRKSLAWASLGEVGRRPVRAFSGGMKRRLELARALMHEPGLLFLDEPTVGLDPQGRRHLWERIEALRQDGLTVFMTTHYLEEAEACDRVGILDGGRLIALGSPLELKESVLGGSEASLEDVFIELTGRQLRDEEAGGHARLVSFAKRGGEHTR